MPPSLSQRCTDLIRELGLGRPEDVGEIIALTGGVASDIAVVTVGNRRYCAKFALPKLKVAADWRAPVERNAAEYAWLKVASDLVPESAVRLYGRSETAHGFAMEYVTGAEVYLWKTALLNGAAPRGEAASVGDMIGRIHAASAQPGFDRSRFQNRDDFRALRIEPYLTYTAGIRPELGAHLTHLADMLYAGDATLIHGDVSPKNILFRDGGPVILDAECATMGDPSFDPAFCLNHLALKAVHLPQSRAALLAEIGAFWQAYTVHVNWEDVAALEVRVAALLPALMLARIDGKSPVEYLDETRREQVRQLAVPLIASPPTTLPALVSALDTGMKDMNA